ncbi:MAG: nucleoside triphosphate pyrophosphohydrolase family protein [Planctomycetota bacterium]|jgi:hypothetical protein
MKYTLNEAIEIALRTWYPEGHILRDDLHHPLGKLLGEWGELLDDYMKSIYKPSYVFDPQDELGDIWYYTRIGIWQLDCAEYDLDIVPFDGSDDLIMAIVIGEIAKTFVSFKQGNLITLDFLAVAYGGLITIAEEYNLSLDDLTASNWEKAKSGPG